MEQVKAALRLAVLAASLVVSATAWAGPTVVLDPGHGGDKTGTRNADGVFEKDITLRIARYAQAALMGKGVPFLERREKNHFIRVDPDEWQQAIDILDQNQGAAR